MLSMITFGVNYRTCPVSVRERFSVAKSSLVEINQSIAALDSIEESVLLSTCNRTEVYAWVGDVDLAMSALQHYFLGENLEDEHHYFYLHVGRDSLYHLAAVASGLDSMVIGETEIFGQLKEAYRYACSAATVGRFAHKIMQRSFTIAKRVRSSSQITLGPTSVGAASVQMVCQQVGSLSGQRVLIVGAGDVARTTAQSLKSRGAEGVFVANRSYDRAVELASQVGGQVIRFADWIPYLEQVDIILVSTASPVYVLSYDLLLKMQHRRNNRPIFVIDLSVPRNVDPQCATVKGVHLRDVDALEAMTRETKQHRQSEIAQCEIMLKEWLNESLDDLLHPSICDLRSRGELHDPSFLPST